MPGVRVEEASHDIDAIRAHQRNHDNPGTGAAEEGLQEPPNAIVKVEVRRTPAERIVHEIERVDQHVHLHEREVGEGQGVIDFAPASRQRPSIQPGPGPHPPFRTITQGQDELKHQEEQVAILGDRVHDGGCIVPKRPSFIVVRWAGGADEVENHRGGQPVGGYRGQYRAERGELGDLPGENHVMIRTQDWYTIWICKKINRIKLWPLR